MSDAGPKTVWIAWTALGLIALLTVALGAALWLLQAWRLLPGDERDSAALVAPIPEPRLQTAPQLQPDAEPAAASGILR